MNDRLTILNGDCRELLKTIPAASVQCVVTSPPYYGLRSYLRKGHPNKALEIGQEKTPQEYVATMVGLFAEVWRVLKEGGVVWLNLGDSYCNTDKWGGQSGGKHTVAADGSIPSAAVREKKAPIDGLKQKDLIGIPWRVALALQAVGWYLRSDIIWAKPNCMPESVTDRPTRSHEYIFLLTKNANYYYDHEAIKEPCVYDVDGTGTAARKARSNEDLKSFPTAERNGMRPGGYKNSVNFNGKNSGNEKQRGHSRRHDGFNDRWHNMSKDEQCTGMRNKRDVWVVAPAQYREAHFAVFPPELIKPCILAGSRPEDLVMDPFGGSGTTGMVSLELGRRALLMDLNQEYIEMQRKRTNVTPGLAF